MTISQRCTDLSQVDGTALVRAVETLIFPFLDKPAKHKLAQLLLEEHSYYKTGQFICGRCFEPCGEIKIEHHEPTEVYGQRYEIVWVPDCHAEKANTLWGDKNYKTYTIID